jgi:hypothetical protein
VVLRTVQIAIGWLVVLLLLASPVAAIALCDTAPVPSSTTATGLDLDTPVELDGWREPGVAQRAANQSEPSGPCQSVRPVSLDGVVAPAPMLPDDAILGLTATPDYAGGMLSSSAIPGFAPGLSPPPESPPPRTTASN